ncbi:photosystem I subunit VI [Pycnococcus provasolii]
MLGWFPTIIKGKSPAPRLPVSVRAASARTSSRRSIRAVAAYKPEESKYFDIADMENTTGAWNLYGQDDKARYPESQAEFFERAGANLARRESLLAFIGIFGAGGVVAAESVLTKAWKVNGAGNGLPEGWEQPMGPRDRL